MADDEAPEDERGFDRHPLNEARARFSSLQRVDRLQADAGGLPGVSMDFVCGRGFEGRGVDRAKSEGTQANPVDDAVAARPRQLV